MKGWSRPFEDPIAIVGGSLVTLRDAGRYIAALPAKKQNAPQWQTATEALLMAAEGRGPLMHARIGMLRAIHHGKPKPDAPPRRKRARAFRILR